MDDRRGVDVEDLPPFVVGIGASAGGLESLERFFKSLAPDSGMAFVVIQHLSPDFKSMMDELLARDTAMLIRQAEDGMLVQANQVYLLPPKKEMVIAGGRLRVTDKDPQRGLTLPIDIFFTSLAEDYDSRAIAVVLSGSGSDGSRGIIEVAKAGGLVLCESSETARFDGMPSSAQATGTVDAVLRPEEMGPLLMRYAANPLLREHGQLLPAVSDGYDTGLQGLEAILALFRSQYDLDFAQYKESTVLRRINRRLTLSDVENLDQYVERLRSDRAELNRLYEDLLIGVTQFFRDRESFEYMEHFVIPRLLAGRDEASGLRIWVAGCATGEEAYSLAISFHEALSRAGGPVNLKIFATDAHRASLARAARGVYTEAALREVSPARLRRYFTRRENAYQIAQEIRELIVFAPHNVLKDAPFTDLDLVSCRNLLIYLQNSSQQKVLSFFHFALNSGGILLLGNSESPGELSSEFVALDEHHKVFQKRRDIRLPAELRQPSRLRTLTSPALSPKTASLRSGVASSLLLGVYDQLLDRYMPPSLLVSESRELVDSFGGAEKLLRIRPRRPSLDVLDMLDPEIRTTVLGALQRAINDDKPVRFAGVRLQIDEQDQLFNLSVEPLRNPATDTTHYLLTFEPRESPQPAEAAYEPAPVVDRVSLDHVLRVEEELRYAKENLQATIEELETSNEELQATNEELVASNEELQSTNEELHSVNEELYTVNAEYQKKIAELAELNQDLNHLLENTDLATIFLDRELHVRRFTARACELFDLLDRDVGRPLTTFSHRLAVEDLMAELRLVLRDGTARQGEVHGLDGKVYLMRILPYRVNEQISGIVLSLVDISMLEGLRGRLRWMSAIVESSEDAIIGLDLDGKITSWNRGAERLYGYSAAEAIGRHTEIIMPPERLGETSQFLEQIRVGESVEPVETVRVHKSGRRIDVSVTVSPVRDALLRVVGASKIDRDITERKASEAEIGEQIRQRERFLAMLSHELRNPLGAVLNATRLLRHENCPPEARTHAVETIQRQASLMGALLGDLLDVARIAQGKIELKRTPVDLVGLLDAVQETAAPSLIKHRTELVVDRPTRPLVVEGDAARLIQIQVNLIANAAKYSPPGKTVYVSLRRDVDDAIIAVRDEGVGIAPEFLPRIFEPFIQSDETLHRAEGGLGVGLTLAKSLVELHGGTIEATSEGRNQGSEFLVRLPLERHPARDERAPAQQPAWQPAAAPRRIVLVEDMADNLRLLKSLLELEGHEVLGCQDGESGCAAVLEQRPDAALIDIGLPGIDGYEVARRVRRQPECDSVLLVALTGYGQRADIEQARRAGFDAHLVKPLDPEALRRLLAECQSPTPDASRASRTALDC